MRLLPVDCRPSGFRRDLPRCDAKRQAQPHAGFFTADKRFEDLGKDVQRYARAIVSHIQLDKAIRSIAEIDFDFAALRHGIESIEHQIE